MKPELGVCYYPEHRPQTLWRVDAERMEQARWINQEALVRIYTKICQKIGLTTYPTR